MNTTLQAITGYYTQDDSELSGELPENSSARWWRRAFCGRGESLHHWAAISRPQEERFGGP